MTVHTVSSGITSSGLTIGSEDSLTVLDGGVAVACTIISGGVETVSGGGVTSNTTVQSGGMLTILSGGLAHDLSVVSGASFVDSGAVNLVSGDVINGGTIAAGGALTYGSGAEVSTGIVLNGELVIADGATFGSANASFTVSGGGTIDVRSGGNLLGEMTADVAVHVESGAILANIGLANGSLVVLAGGTVVGTELFGELAQVNAGGTFDDNDLAAGDVVDVTSGAEASFTTVDDTSMLRLEAGADVHDVAVLSGGTLVVSAGASLTNLYAPFPGGPPGGTVQDYGTITLSAASDVTGVTVESGGTLVVDSGGILAGATLSSIVNFGLIELNSGTSLGNAALGSSYNAVLVVNEGAHLFGTVETEGTIVFDGAQQGTVFIQSSYVELHSGATVSGASFSGNCFVSALAGTTVTDGQFSSGFLQLEGAADDYGATFTSGAYLTMSAGAVDSGSTYLASSYLYASGGQVTDDTFYGSGSITESAEIDGALVEAGGELYVASGAVGNDVEVRGSAYVFSGGSGSYWTVDHGGLLYDTESSLLQDVDVQSGIFYLSGADASVITTGADTTDASIQLATDDITLELVSYAGPLATIEGFTSAGQRLELDQYGGLITDTDYTIGNNDEVTFNTEGGSITLHISGASEGEAFRMIDGGAAGTYVIEVALSPTSVGLSTVSDSGVQGDNLTNDNTPTLTGHGVSGDTITLYEGATVLGSAMVTAGSWHITLATPLSDGTHVIEAVQSHAGTNDSNPTSYNLTIDTSVPAAPANLVLSAATDTAVAGDNITADASPTLTGTGHAGDTIVVYSGALLVGTTTVGEDGTWQAALSTFPDGIYELFVGQINPAGTGSPPSTVSVRIDTTPPAPPTADLTTATDTGTLGDGVTSDHTPVFTGTGEVNSIIRIIDTATNTVLGTTTVALNGQWSISLPSTAVGLYTLSVTSTDKAGNMSATPYALVVDPSLLDPPTLGETAGHTDPARPQLEGLTAPGSTVSLYDGENLLGMVTANSDGVYSFTPPAALAIGSNPITAVASNLAGTTSPVSAVFMVVVGGDGSYVTQTSPDANGSIVITSYDDDGAYMESDTYSSDGLLLQDINPDSVLRNIYDTAGTLIGTVMEPGSEDSSVPPGYESVRQTLAATTSTDVGASVITLMGETNTMHLGGNDTVSAGSGTVTIITGAGDVQVQGGSGSLTFFGGSGTALVVGGSAAIVAVTGSGGGVITGSAAGGNLLAAGGGNSTLNGAGSNDTLFGANSGNTVINGGSGHDIFVAGAGAVTMNGGSMSSLFFGGRGISVINAGPAAHDVVVAGSGESIIHLSGGDAAFASIGYATIYGSAEGNDTMVGGGGGAEMIGGGGNTEFVGTQGSSTVFGGAGNDTVFTGNGSMEAVLGNGTDHVIAGSGDAVIYAGLGSDLFSVFAGHAGGTDVLYGFNAATDHLQLAGYAAGDIQEAVTGGNTVLTLSDNTHIVLQGITSLSASSFI